MGKTPALPGRLLEFGNSGDIRKPPLSDPLKGYKKEAFDDRFEEFKSHDMGL